MLDRHERSADADYERLDLMEDGAVSVADRYDDLELVVRLGCEAFLPERREQPVPIGDPRCLDLNVIGNLAPPSLPPVCAVKRSGPTSASGSFRERWP